MTYDEIIATIRERHFEYLESTLERAVEEEARALREMHGSRKQTQKFLRESEAQAKEYYAGEITNFFEAGGGQITADMILHNRRLPTAWAVAQKLLGAQYSCPYCNSAIEFVAKHTLYDYTTQSFLESTLFQCKGVVNPEINDQPLTRHHIYIIDRQLNPKEVSNG